jgi:uncharacterized membrane protein YgdD (TMEM256/DUF423 family)
MNKQLIILATLAGASAVILGAFGAHALKALITVAALENWETAVNYQFVHTLAILFMALLPRHAFVRAASWCFGLGILCFSGSLYLLSLREVINLPISFLGPVTPFGGLLFVAGWLYLLAFALKKN